MLRNTMATTKSKATPAATTPNALVVVADAAQRKLLLATLRRNRWNMAHAATELRLSGGPAVIQYLKRLDPAEYVAAKADGRIKAGARPKA